LPASLRVASGARQAQANYDYHDCDFH